VRLVRDRNGRSKGFAFVQFASSAAVEKAMELDKEYIANRPIKIKRSETAAKVESEKSTGGVTLFGYNFSLSTNETDLRSLFRASGAIVSMRLGKKGRPDGVAHC